MNLKKKKTIIAVSVITGACVLAVSAFANYSTANGYDVYKKGIKSLIGQENYTLNATASLLTDGEKSLETTLTEKYDRNGEVVLNAVHNSKELIGECYESGYREIIQGGKSYYYYNNGENNIWEVNDYRSDKGGTLDLIPADEKETADKVIRFAELLTDTVVGDLKNNFIYISDTESGGAKYSVSLDAIQIPELINAGISAVCSLNSYDASYNDNEYYKNLTPSDVDYYLYHDATVKSVSCDFEVDGEGRLTDNVMTIEIESEDGHKLEMKFEINVSDFGTTVPEALDPNAKVVDSQAEYKAIYDTEAETAIEE